MVLEHRHIDRLQGWAISLPVSHGFNSARSRLDARQVLIIRIDTGGLSGWGEAAPVPGHTREDFTTLWNQLQRLAAPVAVPQEGMLAAAFNQAYSDLESRRAGMPLWRHLGGERKVIRASVAIGVDGDGQPDSVGLYAAAQKGYRNAKLKVTQRTRPSRVAAAMAEYPEITFAVDANGSLDLTNQTLLAALDEMNLSYIEQPGDPADLGLHARLRKQLSTPIALDESASTPASVTAIIDAGAADIVNLKTGRFGTAETIDLAVRAREAGLEVRIGGLLESGIGRAHSLAAATHASIRVVGDLAASDSYFADDLVRPQWRLQGGNLHLPENPGIGVVVDAEALEAASIESLTVA